jgi:energy-converting hydrogenase Eha subunit G
MKLSQWALIYGIAFALFAAAFAVRFLSPPAWLNLTIYGIFAAPVIWLACRELIKRQAEKRVDREAAWRTFVRDRNAR